MGWHPRYMNYAIQNQVNQGWAKKYQMGTAQQFIRKNDLAKMDIYDANLDITMKLNEVADILPGTTPTQAGDTMFQRTGSPGKNRYYDEPELTGKLRTATIKPLTKKKKKGKAIRKVSSKSK